MADKNSSAECVQKKSRKQNGSMNKNSKLKKRQPHKFESSKNTIYVCTNSNTKELLETCNKLILDDQENEIILYCLGAAIRKGILLSLQICDNHPSFQEDVNTLTTELTDDLEPAADDGDYEMIKRMNSGLRIRIFRKDSLKSGSKSQPIDS